MKCWTSFHKLSFDLHWFETSVVDPEPYKLKGTDPHKIERYDPDLDPRKRDKLDRIRIRSSIKVKLDPDPDPYQFSHGKPKCIENEPISALFQGFEPFLEAIKVGSGSGSSCNQDPDLHQCDADP